MLSGRPHLSNLRPMIQSVKSPQRITEEHWISAILLAGRYCPAGASFWTSFDICHHCTLPSKILHVHNLSTGLVRINKIKQFDLSAKTNAEKEVPIFGDKWQVKVGPILPWRTGGLSAYPHHGISSEESTAIWPSGSQLGSETRTLIRNDEQGNVQYTKASEPLLPGCGKYQARDSDSEFTTIAPQTRVSWE